MTVAQVFREEIRHLRVLATTIEDPAALGEIEIMIQELDRRARGSENGSAPPESSDCGAEVPYWPRVDPSTVLPARGLW